MFYESSGARNGRGWLAQSTAVCVLSVSFGYKRISMKTSRLEGSTGVA